MAASAWPELKPGAGLPVTFTAGQVLSAFAVGDGVNQPLGVFALPAGAPGFLLPLGMNAYLPLAMDGYTP